MIKAPYQTEAGSWKDSAVSRACRWIWVRTGTRSFPESTSPGFPLSSSMFMLKYGHRSHVTDDGLHRKRNGDKCVSFNTSIVVMKAIITNYTSFFSLFYANIQVNLPVPLHPSCLITCIDLSTLLHIITFWEEGEAGCETVKGSRGLL